MAYNEVVDPSILRRLEIESGSGSNQNQSAISFDNTSSNADSDTGFKEVTDPKILNRLESQLPPSRMQSVLQGMKVGLQLPLMQAGQNLHEWFKNTFPEPQEKYDPYRDAQILSSAKQKAYADALQKNPEYLAAQQVHPNYTQGGKLAGEGLPMIALSAFPEFRAATMRNRMAANATLGGVTSSDPTMGAFGGAAAEPAANIVGKTGGALWKALTGSPLQGMARDLWNTTIGSLRGVDDKTIASLEGQAHNKALAQAEQASLNPKYKWDNSSYKDALQQKIDEITADHLSTTSTSPEWLGAVQLLNEWKNNAPDDIYGMIKTNKALNQIFGKQVSPGVRIPEWLPAFGISAIKNTINKNLESNGLSKTLGNSINEANRFTKERVKKEIFSDARDEHELLNKFNSLDKHTRENLFNDNEINSVRQFERTLKGDKRIDQSLPPGAGLEAHTIEFSKDILKRLLPNMAVPEFAEPGNR